MGRRKPRRWTAWTMLFQCTGEERFAVHIHPSTGGREKRGRSSEHVGAASMSGDGVDRKQAARRRGHPGGGPAGARRRGNDGACRKGSGMMMEGLGSGRQRSLPRRTRRRVGPPWVRYCQGRMWRGGRVRGTSPTRRRAGIARVRRIDCRKLEASRGTAGKERDSEGRTGPQDRAQTRHFRKPIYCM